MHAYSMAPDFSQQRYSRPSYKTVVPMKIYSLYIPWCFFSSFSLFLCSRKTKGVDDLAPCHTIEGAKRPLLSMVTQKLAACTCDITSNAPTNVFVCTSLHRELHDTCQYNVFQMYLAIIQLCHVNALVNKRL